MANYNKIGIQEKDEKVFRNSKQNRESKTRTPLVSAEVIAGLKDGDHIAFETVFHGFYYRVLNFLRSITKDTNVAEELTQQVFVNIWENRSSLDPAKSFNSYIYVIAKNAAMGYFRTSRIHRVIEKQVFTDEPVVSVESEVFAREARLLVELAVSQMPRQRKRIYELSQLENKSNNEIAEELKITKKAVEKHLRLANSDIRTVLQRFVMLFML